MPRRTRLGCGFLVLLFTLPGLAEQKPANNLDLVEFPVFMQQKVTAGITPVGAKVKAKLTISTLVKGTVVPQGAILSGEVTESEAKSADAPSKLGIRMDMAQWKNGSLSIKVYLTEWYYPSKSAMGEDNDPGFPGIHGSVGITMGGGAPYPPNDSTGPGGHPFPGDRPSTIPPAIDPDTTRTGNVSPHRVRMKNVESKRAEDGSISLLSKKSSLKLDKNTTYVLAAGDLLPPN
jgi:hypothetical protein